MRTYRYLRIFWHCRQVLMNLVKQTADLLFGDVPDLDSRKAVELATDRAGNPVKKKKKKKQPPAAP